MGKRVFAWCAGAVLLAAIIGAGVWFYPAGTPLAAPVPGLTPGEREQSLLKRHELRQEQVRGWWQNGYWSALALAGMIGFYLTLRRIRALEANTKTEHNDRMLSEHMERFSDPKNTVSVRIGGVIGLGSLADVVDPLDKKRHPYRDQVVNLLVESLVNHPNMAILDTIRDQLVEIGPPAIRRLASRHRERFETGIKELFSDIEPEKETDPLDTAFMASRDAIARILTKHAACDLVMHGWLEGKITPQWRRLLAWVRREEVPQWAVPDLHEINLTAANLREATLSGANLGHANLSDTKLESAKNWEKTEDCLGSNWWDADIFDEQKKWFQEHYPMEKNKLLYDNSWNTDGTRKGPFA